MTKTITGVEEAIDRIAGPYHVFISAMSVVAFNTAGFYMYNMHYNQMMPKYECYKNSQWESCEPKNFCQSNGQVEFREVESDGQYLVNWV
jgi:hypothetical protein